MNELLAICIPTYNGGNKLAENLRQLIPQAKKSQIPIFVSDNHSTNDTIKILQEMQKQYQYLFYYEQESNKGFCKNYDYVLRMANTKYRWLLGDDDIILGGALDFLMKLVQNDYSFIIVNGYADKNASLVRIIKTPQKVYHDKNDILHDLGDYMSWITSTIYSAESLKTIDISRHKDGDNAFPHLIEIFAFLACTGDISLCWIDELFIRPNNDSCTYTDKIFKIFIDDWYYLYNNFQSYSKSSRDSFLLGLKKHNSAINWKTLINLRRQNLYNYQIYKHYKCNINWISNSHEIVWLLIAIFPEYLFDVLYRAYTLFKD